MARFLNFLRRDYDFLQLWFWSVVSERRSYEPQASGERAGPTDKCAMHGCHLPLPPVETVLNLFAEPNLYWSGHFINTPVTSLTS